MELWILENTSESLPNQIEVVTSIVKIEHFLHLVNFKSFSAFVEDSDDIMNFDILKPITEVFKQDSKN